MLLDGTKCLGAAGNLCLNQWHRVIETERTTSQSCSSRNNRPTAVVAATSSRRR